MYYIDVLLCYGISATERKESYQKKKRCQQRSTCDRVDTDVVNQNWLHFVPVVGCDENDIYIAESLKELVNCNERYYNRKIAVGACRKLWNTSMLKMPCYRNTYITAETQ